ncbi:MAG: glycosyltransferase family 2 protein [Proteobacteria bacterium]|nr:glycosyltransferase family 2 protein [Pseudomonadota bacterium]
MTLPSICVVVTTYNWPQALSRVLNGLSLQKYPNMEVIIADDGSTDETAQVVSAFRKKMPFALTHCWQPDEGFRAAMCRNKAVAKTKADYIIFIDGDCVPCPQFVQRHAHLAQKGWFVAGTRVLLSQSFSKAILHNDLAIEAWSYEKWVKAFLQRGANRLLPKLYWPLGILRTLTPSKWQGVKTCNLGIWREDFIAVNGLDENFVGWGFEDSDLIIRLQRLGIKRKSGKFATEVFHLWHPENSRQQMNENKERLASTINSLQVKATLGIEQYI